MNKKSVVELLGRGEVNLTRGNCAHIFIWDFKGVIGDVRNYKG